MAGGNGIAGTHNGQFAPIIVTGRFAKGKEMDVFVEEDRESGVIGGYPRFAFREGKTDEPRHISRGGASVLKTVSLRKALLVTFIVITVMTIVSLAAMVSTMSDELKEMKSRLREIQGAGATIEALNREQGRLRSEISRLSGNVNAMNVQQRRQAELMDQRKAAETRNRAGNMAGANKPGVGDRRQ
jgi:hypothetical protein